MPSGLHSKTVRELYFWFEGMSKPNVIFLDGDGHLFCWGRGDACTLMSILRTTLNPYALGEEVLLDEFLCYKFCWRLHSSAAYCICILIREYKITAYIGLTHFLKWKTKNKYIYRERAHTSVKTLAASKLPKWWFWLLLATKRLQACLEFFAKEVYL